MYFKLIPRQIQLLLNHQIVININYQNLSNQINQNVNTVFPWNIFVTSAWDYFGNALLFFIRFRENNFLLNLNLHQTWNMIHVSTCSFLKDMSRFSKPHDDANMTRAGYPILQFLLLLQFYADNKNIICTIHLLNSACCLHRTCNW